MRVLVVVASMALGLSGCISGGIVHRAPDGNETTEEGDASAVEQAPWQLNGTAGARDDAGQAGKGGADGKGAPKGGSGAGGGGDGSGDDPDDPDDGMEPPPEDEADGLDAIREQAPTEGAASADDILTGAGDAVEEGADTNAPKAPLGDTDPEDASVGVPVKGAGAGVPGAPKEIPNTDSSMLA